MGALSGGAIALALVALAESIGTARSLAAQRGYEIDPNQELVALGASNLGAGLLQGFPVDASLSRSAVGAGAGVRTRLSGLFVALLHRGDDALPDAALRRAAAGDARRDHHRRRRSGSSTSAGSGGCGASTRATPGSRSSGSPPSRSSACCPGIVVAVVASLLALIRRAYRPRIAVLGRVADEASADENYRFRSVDRHPEYETIPGLVLFRFANELFFANASYFRDETLRLVDESDPPARTVLVDASVISHADTTALAMLDDLLDQLELRGVTLEFARAQDGSHGAARPHGHQRPDRPAMAFHRSVHAGVESFLRRSQQPAT